MSKKKATRMEAGRTLTDQGTSMAIRRVFHLELQVESLRERVEKQDAEIDGLSRRLSVATTVLTAEKLGVMVVQAGKERLLESAGKRMLDQLDAAGLTIVRRDDAS
jgi:hypothetical protein